MSDENKLSNEGTPSPADASHDETPVHEMASDAASNTASNEPASEYDIAGVVLGVAGEAETARVLSATAADPSIDAEWNASMEVVAELARLAPRQTINRGRSAGIRSRLVSRAAASREGRAAVPRKTAEIIQPWFKRAGVVDDPNITVGGGGTTSGGGAASGGAANTVSTSGLSHRQLRNMSAVPAPRRVWPWLLLAACVGIVVAGIQQMRIQDVQNQLRSSVAQREDTMLSQMASLKGSMATKDSLIESLTGPDMRVVNLVNYSSQDPLARMFWNRKTQEWIMYAYHLRQPQPGKTFQVWLVSNASPNPISAGTFQPDAKGTAVMRAKYAMAKDALVKVAVSEEPAGGMPYPTGPIIIAGR